jgi:hypothetical protein
MDEQAILGRLAALLRSPIANLASVTVGAGKRVLPGTFEMISRVNGLAAQAQTWAVTIYPAPEETNPQAPPVALKGANPWTYAFLRWSVGNNSHQAVIDVGAGQTLLLSFDTLEVWIGYFPPPEFANAAPVDWRVSVASSFSGMPPALPTRTISGAGDAVVFVPAWAQSVTPLCPAAGLPYVADFTDPLGGVLGSVYGTGTDQQSGPIDLPNGTQAVTISGGPNARWSLVFRLAI